MWWQDGVEYSSQEYSTTRAVNKTDTEADKCLLNINGFRVLGGWPKAICDIRLISDFLEPPGENK